jgi:tight adherence protein B
MRRAALLVLAAAMLAAPAAAAATDGVEIVDVDVSSYPEVVVTVAVPDSPEGEEPAADDFVLIENGYTVSAGVWTFEPEPVDVVLVMDTSGSMAGEPMADAKAAAREFLDRLPEGARVAVVSFGAEAEVAHALDGDASAAAAALDGLTAGGETALYDALITAVGTIEPGDGRGVMLVLSDGGDTASEAGLGEAIEALRSSGLETSVIALQTEETDASALSAVAAVGGGGLVSVAEASDLAEAFGSVADGLGRRFRLAYLSRQSGTVEIVVALRDAGGGTSAATTVQLPGAPVVAAPSTTIAGGSEANQPPATEPVQIAAGEESSLLAGRWTLPAGVATAVGGTVSLLMLLVLGRRRKDPGFAVPEGNGIVSSLAHRAEDLTERVMKARTGGLERDLDRAGIELRPGEFVVLSASLGVAVVAVGLLVFGGPIAIAAALLAVLGPRAVLRVLMARRRSAFADQFEGTLQMISGGLRAGYGLMQSVATVAEEAPSPTSEEFSRVVVENQLGRSVDDSLRAMAERMDNEDLRWVTEAIDIQYEVGGDLAEVLDTVAATIRDRDQIRRQVKALSAEGRMSAVILISMPFGLAFLISVMSPDYLAELTGTGIGRAMILGALVMIGVGAAWIKRIVKVVF